MAREPEVTHQIGDTHYVEHGVEAERPEAPAEPTAETGSAGSMACRVPPWFAARITGPRAGIRSEPRELTRE